MLGIKAGEPGFELIVWVTLAVGLVIVAVCFWMARKWDQRNAEKYGESKFTLTRFLIVVAIVATLVSVFCFPSVPRDREKNQEAAGAPAPR